MVSKSRFEKLLTFILIISLSLLVVSCGKQETKSNGTNKEINFANEQLEELVENVLNKSKEELNSEEFQLIIPAVSILKMDSR